MEITIKLINQVGTIFGWFWLMVYILYRVQFLKKIRFVVYVFIFFGMALAKIQELFVFNFDLSKNIGMYQIINWLMIYMYYTHISTIVKLKEKNHENT